MHISIALFRGINVGGTGKLPMQDLKTLLTDMGLLQVTTYIQSGNVVFAGKAKPSPSFGQQISARIQKQFGFSPHVLVLSLAELKKAADGNPFKAAKKEPKSLHVGFLATAPKRPNRAKLDALKATSEEYRLQGSVFYLHAPDGVGKSKLAAGAEKALGVVMTDRNWNTVQKLLEMATGLQAE